MLKSSLETLNKRTKDEKSQHIECATLGQWMYAVQLAEAKARVVESNLSSKDMSSIGVPN
jgi:hypothetical protein